MGVPWLFEVLSLIIRFDLHPWMLIIETIWDVLNCLQGTCFRFNCVDSFLSTDINFRGVYFLCICVQAKSAGNVTEKDQTSPKKNVFIFWCDAIVLLG